MDNCIRMNLHKIKYEAKKGLQRHMISNKILHLPILKLGHSEGKERISSNRFVSRIEIMVM